MMILEFLLRFSTVLVLLAALVMVIGIVWRVEAELDRAYKWFSLSVVFFLASEILEVVPSLYTLVWGGVALSSARFLAAVALVLGMYFMRDLVRRMDGEKTESRKA